MDHCVAVYLRSISAYCELYRNVLCISHPYLSALYSPFFLTKTHFYFVRALKYNNCPKILLYVWQEKRGHSKRRSLQAESQWHTRTCSRYANGCCIYVATVSAVWIQSGWRHTVLHAQLCRDVFLSPIFWCHALIESLWAPTQRSSHTHTHTHTYVILRGLLRLWLLVHYLYAYISLFHTPCVLPTGHICWVGFPLARWL